MAKAELQAVIAEIKLSIKSEFVPFSASRNAKEKHPSLNWRVTLQRDSRDILTTDYSAGCAQCPSYKQTFGQRTVADKERDYMVRWECEFGGRALGVRWGNQEAYGGQAGTLRPSIVDVVHSLVMDSDVLDYDSFESWAGEFGYDPDSRKKREYLSSLPGNWAKIAQRDRRGKYYQVARSGAGLLTPSN